MSARVQRPPGNRLAPQGRPTGLDCGGRGLGRRYRRFDLFETNVLELRHRGRTAVKLERQDALEFTATRIIVLHLRGQPAIYSQCDSVTNASEVILMPVFESKPSRAFGRRDFRNRAVALGIEDRPFTTPRQRVAAKLVIEPHQPGRLEIVVHLVATDVVIRQQPAAKLKTVVDATLAIKRDLSLSSKSASSPPCHTRYWFTEQGCSLVMRAVIAPSSTVQ